jgi:pimeloyl-ACP methyl ester carboxylesterase
MNKKVKKISSKEKWMRRFFSVAGNIAPTTTAYILVKLLFTPKKRILRPSHIQCLEQAEKFEFIASEFQNPAKKIKLHCFSWGKGDKTVILVHGWDARAIDFYKMIPPLVEAGYKVIAFDGPAHGDSEGERSHLIDFKQVLYQMVKQWGPPYAIIGHSMGGGAATFMLMDYKDVGVDKLVSIAGTIVSRRFFESVFDRMKVPSKMQRAFFTGYTEELGEPVEHYDLLERKDPIKAKDFLLVYDENDEVLNAKDVKEYLRRNPRVKSYHAENTGHYNIIKNKGVIEEVIKFLAEPVK